MLIRCVSFKLKAYSSYIKRFSSIADIDPAVHKFQTVFKFPFIKYISFMNRLKVYHGAGAALALPTCGILEFLSVLPEQSFFAASYIGITSAAVLSLASVPFSNVIGFLYISEDNQFIKISHADFWGRRIDRIIPTEDWIPLNDMSPKKLDPLFLSPELADKTKYKLFVKFGKVLNAEKIGQVLE